MTASAQLDSVERAIVAALHISPRAPWELIARALGVSESTVARRAQRLLASGLVTVVGMTEEPRGSRSLSASIRLACKPGTAAKVARTIAKDPQVRFVGLLTGPSACLVEAVAPGREELMSFLEQRLATIDGVLQHASRIILRSFTGAYAWDPGILDATAAAEIRKESMLPASKGTEAGDHGKLDVQESAILGALRGNGRMSVLELAAAANTSPSTAKRRMDALLERGILHFRTVVEPSLLGFDVELMMWLDSDRSSLRQTADTLAAHPAVRYLIATTGDTPLFATAVLPHNDDIFAFLTDVIGTLPGARNVETQLLLGASKRHWHLTPA